VANKSTALEHDLQTPLRMISESVSRATDVAVQVRRLLLIQPTPLESDFLPSARSKNWWPS
jgi:hypothetical protein